MNGSLSSELYLQDYFQLIALIPENFRERKNAFSFRYTGILWFVA